MVKTNLTPLRTYSAPNTFVTQIHLEENFTGTTIANANDLEDMDIYDLEDEDFE